MPKAGIGVDIVSVARMRKVMDRRPSFCQRMFTEEERIHSEMSPYPEQHYAARLAAREAVLKALGTGYAEGIGRRDVSVSLDQYGKPQAHLSGKAAELASKLGVLEVVISLSHTRDVALANAIAVTEEVRPKQAVKDDAASELARSFKDARHLIDELDKELSEELAELDQ